MSDFLDYLWENKIPVAITVSVALLLILALVALFPSPFSGGYVMSKYMDEEKQWDGIEEEAQYRTIYVPVTRARIDSEGRTSTYVTTESRQVYDHTDLVTYHYIDDKDFILIINSFDNKAGYNWYQRTFQKNRANKDFIVYVEETLWEGFGIERSFVTKEHKHEYWLTDHITKREIDRRNR